MSRIISTVRRCLEQAGYTVDSSSTDSQDYVVATCMMTEDIEMTVMAYVTERGAALQTFVPNLYPASSVQILGACLAIQAEMTYVRFFVDEDTQNVCMHVDLPVRPFPKDLYINFMGVLPNLLLNGILPTFLAVDPEGAKTELNEQAKRLDDCRSKLEELFKR